jgi:phage/plasmid-like protein (TIGR03299 family)
MAHNINRTNGKDSMVYAGETPWHRLGTALPECFTAADALKHGGLDFDVLKVPIYLDGGVQIPGRHALQRTDTKDVLGLCADMYQPLQNREAFSFFDGVFGKDKARYETAGVLGKGEKIWLLAKLPGDFAVQGNDVVGKWLLLTNGHDTNEPIRARFTPIRVVCQNTLTAALRGKASEVRVQHIGRVPDKLRLAGKLLKEAGVYFEDIQAAFQGFSKRQLKAEGLRKYALDVIAADRAPGVKFEDLHPVTRNRVIEIEKRHESGRGTDMKGVRGTLWGAYNAVTEWIDHDRAEGRDLGYLIHGGGANLKERAFQVAADLVKANN